ncbi:hypothetical protein Cgig2_028767 [Carnegiea gigantea]|uniref:Uncharacterized protein n=1 Tax=Carnegiea gigantea TaxID=171969 RepID=A0A9Q1GLS4_9CARY|nr:hypothetical protein Cgig2_028767 [Carnegiea gigantea]
MQIPMAELKGPLHKMLYTLLRNLRGPLSKKLHKDIFTGIHEQQRITRRALEIDDPLNPALQIKGKKQREQYTKVLSSSLSLIKQQCKFQWLNQGDHCTKWFFAKMKQRQLNSFVYTIQDEHGQEIEGFDKVGSIMTKFYQELLSKQSTRRNPIDAELINEGPFTAKDVKDVTFSIPSAKPPGPDAYRCIFKQNEQDRVQVISRENNQETYHMGHNELTAIYRNFLWGEDGVYKKIPYVNWNTTCSPQKNGGLRLKLLEAWNQAHIAKLVWAIAKKKDLLWLKWVHERYLRFRT